MQDGRVASGDLPISASPEYPAEKTHTLYKRAAPVARYQRFRQAIRSAATIHRLLSEMEIRAEESV
jgi:hypothetical protein